MYQIDDDSIRTFASIKGRKFASVPIDFLMAMFGELRALKSKVAVLEERVREEEGSPKTPKSPPKNDGPRIIPPPERTEAMEALIEDYHDHCLREIAQDRQRISALERPRTEPQKTPLVDRLAAHMRDVGLIQVGFTAAGRILGVTRQRVHQVKALIATDPRFMLMPSESHKTKLLIRMRCPI